MGVSPIGEYGYHRGTLTHTFSATGIEPSGYGVRDTCPNHCATKSKACSYARKISYGYMSGQFFSQPNNTQKSSGYQPVKQWSEQMPFTIDARGSDINSDNLVNEIVPMILKFGCSNNFNYSGNIQTSGRHAYI